MTRRSRPAVLHHDPPAIPAGVLLHHPAIIGAPVVASLTVGVLAFVDDGSALRL